MEENAPSIHTLRFLFIRTSGCRPFFESCMNRYKLLLNGNAITKLSYVFFQRPIRGLVKLEIDHVILINQKSIG